jgi:hypothetical protein
VIKWVVLRLEEQVMLLVSHLPLSSFTLSSVLQPPPLNTNSDPFSKLLWTEKFTGVKSTSPVKLFVISRQHGRDDVTIALLLPSLRKRSLTKFVRATSADSMSDEIECYHTTLHVFEGRGEGGRFYGPSLTHTYIQHILQNTGNLILIFHFSTGQA